MSRAADLLERAAQRLRDVPQPDRHEAVIEMLADAILEVAQTNPSAQADRVERISRVMRG